MFIFLAGVVKAVAIVAVIDAVNEKYQVTEKYIKPAVDVACSSAQAFTGAFQESFSESYVRNMEPGGLYDQSVAWGAGVRSRVDAAMAEARNPLQPYMDAMADTTPEA